MLEVSGLCAGYQAGAQVLQDLSLSVRDGEILALLGRNGMGKTTLMRALTGHLPITAGQMTLDGRELRGLAPFEIARAGVGLVPQGREVFPDLSVAQNLLLGVLGKPSLPATLPDSAFAPFPMLGERRAQRAGSLSGGQQQQLAIMRALIGQPKLLLLDEPSEGIQPSIVQDIAATLRRIADQSGLTILLVEQNLNLVLNLASRCLFIENGRIVEELTDVSRLRDDRDLVRKYLSA